VPRSGPLAPIGTRPALLKGVGAGRRGVRGLGQGRIERPRIACTDSLNMILPIGFALALVGSMPMSGPVAVLFMARVLKAETTAAFLIALGGALVEALYALAIALSLPRLVDRAATVRLGSLALGSLVVFGLGLTLLIRPDAVQRSAGAEPQRGFFRGALSSLLNPTLIATWTVAVGALYANGLLEPKTSSAIAFAVGVALGSVAWFSVVLAVMTVFRDRVTPARQRKTLRAMGVLLLLSGVYLAVRFVNELSDGSAISATGRETVT
jgi:threonine/homoserine/homoserine lactone efflux protein